MRKPHNLLPAVFVGSSLLAIGTAPQKELSVQLKFVPQENVGVQSVVLPVRMLERSVSIQVDDSRSVADSNRLGTGTDDDDRPFPIRTAGDVKSFVGETLAGLATERGLKIVAAPVRHLRVRSVRFWVSEANKALGSTYAAEVQFGYTLADSEGRQLVEGSAAGGANRYGRARSGENCMEVLSDALKEAFMNVLADSQLQRAWGSDQPPGVNASIRPVQ